MSIIKRSGKYGDYYVSQENTSSLLNYSQMVVNATYIYKYLSSKGWSRNAIAGMLGNMQVESTINPGIWQSNDVGNMSGGFGLVQWTPATNYINWCDDNGLDYTEMDSNLKRIIYELENNLQWIATSDYDLSFKEFTTSTKTASYLASAFLKNYERAGVEKEEIRQSNSESWYKLFNGVVAYAPRLNSDGMEGSFYWYSENPFYLNGYGLPNCTCYAWGRFWEIGDHTGNGSNKPNLPTSSGGLWFPEVQETGTYETGRTAELGAVMCWYDSETPNENGHVAIVEEIKEDGTIITSNSAWDGTYFYLQTIENSDNYNLPGLTFQGFIYNPFTNIDININTGKKKRNKYNFILFKKRRRILR